MVDKIIRTRSLPSLRWALNLKPLARSIHGQRFHQQAIAEAFIAEDLMWIIGRHAANL